MFFSNGQKAKLRSIFRYYDYLDTENALDGKLIISRQVLYISHCKKILNVKINITFLGNDIETMVNY